MVQYRDEDKEMTCKPIRILASDLDGTLFYDGVKSNGKVSPENYEAIQRWVKQGNHFLIATGRTAQYRHTFEKETNLKTDIISCNGAKVIIDNQVLWSKEISFDHIQEVVKLLDPFKDELDFCLDMDCSYRVGFNENGRIRKNYSDPNKEYFTVDEYLLEDQRMLPNKIFIVLEDSKRFAYFFTLLTKQFKGKLSVTSSGARFLELVVDGVSKGQALEVLAEKLGYSMDQTAAIGDELNDLDMLQRCPHGYLMSHAGKHMKDLIPKTMDSVHDLIDWCLAYNENI